MIHTRLINYLSEKLFSFRHENVISLGGSSFNEIFEGDWRSFDGLGGGFLTITWLFRLIITFIYVLLLISRAGIRGLKSSVRGSLLQNLSLSKINKTQFLYPFRHQKWPLKVEMVAVVFLVVLIVEVASISHHMFVSLVGDIVINDLELFQMIWYRREVQCTMHDTILQHHSDCTSVNLAMLLVQHSIFDKILRRKFVKLTWTGQGRSNLEPSRLLLCCTLIHL